MPSRFSSTYDALVVDDGSRSGRSMVVLPCARRHSQPSAGSPLTFTHSKVVPPHHLGEARAHRAARHRGREIAPLLCAESRAEDLRAVVVAEAAVRRRLVAVGRLVQKPSSMRPSQLLSRVSQISGLKELTSHALHAGPAPQVPKPEHVICAVASVHARVVPCVAAVHDAGAGGRRALVAAPASWTACRL